MKQIKAINIILVFILQMSCNSKMEKCDTAGYEKLSLAPVKCILQIPEYRIEDSTCYEPETLLNYIVKSKDSVLTAVCIVTSYSERLSAKPDIRMVRMTQKSEVEFGADTANLLSENILDFDTVKVQYLKFLVKRKGETRYEGRVFFYMGDKLVTFWFFEKTKDIADKKQSVIDCIVRNMNFE